MFVCSVRTSCDEHTTSDAVWSNEQHRNAIQSWRTELVATTTMKNSDSNECIGINETVRTVPSGMSMAT